MAAANRGSSIEFIVKPKENLYLEGSLRRVQRVAAGEPYPCQMQKSQSFSCLFRHYAKHNGLRKEDLVFTFVDELLPDQTPESVHLMAHDEIFVKHRKVVEVAKEPVQSKTFYSDHFKEQLLSGEHSDLVFILDNGLVKLKAHKAILSARSEYFRNMFVEGGMKESTKSELTIDAHGSGCFRRMLEFLYTNCVQDLETLDSPELFSLMNLASEYVLKDLRASCERQAAEIISCDNLAELASFLADSSSSSVLRDAIVNFLKDNDNHSALVKNDKIRQALDQNPQLAMLLYESLLEDSSSNGDDVSGKKRKRNNAIDDSEIEDSSGSVSIRIAHSNANVQDS